MGLFKHSFLVFVLLTISYLGNSFASEIFNQPSSRPSKPIDYTINLDIQKRLSQNESINLGHYFNLKKFVGFEIMHIQLASFASYEPMELSFIVDNKREVTVKLNSSYSRVDMYPRRKLIIGSSAKELKILARGAGNVQIDRIIIRAIKK